MRVMIAMVSMGVVMISSSCRTKLPLDPETMKPSCKCMPQNYYHGIPSSCPIHVHEEIIVTK